MATEVWVPELAASGQPVAVIVPAFWERLEICATGNETDRSLAHPAFPSAALKAVPRDQLPVNAARIAFKPAGPSESRDAGRKVARYIHADSLVRAESSDKTATGPAAGKAMNRSQPVPQSKAQPASIMRNSSSGRNKSAEDMRIDVSSRDRNSTAQSPIGRTVSDRSSKSSGSGASPEPNRKPESVIEGSQVRRTKTEENFMRLTSADKVQAFWNQPKTESMGNRPSSSNRKQKDPGQSVQSPPKDPYRAINQFDRQRSAIVSNPQTSERVLHNEVQVYRTAAIGATNSEAGMVAKVHAKRGATGQSVSNGREHGINCQCGKCATLTEKTRSTAQKERNWSKTLIELSKHPYPDKNTQLGVATGDQFVHYA